MTEGSGAVGEPRGITRVGVDIGGTFTDVAAVDAHGRLHIGKRLTTHGLEHEGVIQAVLDTNVDMSAPGTILAHGTTLVINSLLERKGARVALVTTQGFCDILDIGRGNRSEIFKLRFRRDEPLVPPAMRFEVRERARGDGTIETSPTEAELETLVQAVKLSGAEAVAVAFLNAYVAPQNERWVGEYLRNALADLPITLSSDISRQWREFERFTTATANAYIAPVAHRYLHSLVDGLQKDGFSGEFVVLDSSGGAMAMSTASSFPVRAVESGPVGGVIGARELARSLGIGNLVTFDMGGTTAKSALVESGEYATRDLYWIGGEKHGFPLQVSTVDIIEVGVGGGSIAWLDAAGSLQVGPRSAGSSPGPACYGLGGTQPTLTDANLYCGRIDKNNFAGNFVLNVAAAERAIEDLAIKARMEPDRLALGIIGLACMRAASTIRRQTLERGHNPDIYTLLASGGAGPLHVCEIAADVGISRVIVPRFPGHYSAMGMLRANLRVDRREVMVKDIASLDASDLKTMLQSIGNDLTRELKADDATHPLQFTYAVAMRYRGQEHPLWIDRRDDGLRVPDNIAAQLKSAFEAEYVQRYGHTDDLSSIETSELRVLSERVLPSVAMEYDDQMPLPERVAPSLWGGSAGQTDTRVISRSSLRTGDRLIGPAVLYEVGSTTALPPGCSAEILGDGTIVVTVPLSQSG